MPIVGTRAAQYAGWWNQGGSNRIGSITDTTTTATSIGTNFLVRPSYYASWAGVTWAGSAGDSYVTSGSTTIDTTGVGLNGKKCVLATTFRVGTNWMTTAPTDSGFYVGYGVYNVTNSNGTQSYRQTNSYKSNNIYGFSTGDGGNINIPAATFDASYRNKWLTYLAATSDNPTVDFANWTGGSTDTFGYGWGTRAYLINAETGTVIDTGDGWNYGAANSPDLAQYWTWGDGTSSYTLNHFIYYQNDISLYYRNDVTFLSHWYGLGSSLDPGATWPYFYGTGIPATVAGVKAWNRWIFGSAGTVLTNGSGIDYGYTIPIGGTAMGSRAPANTVLRIQADVSATSAQTIPTFISL